MGYVFAVIAVAVAALIVWKFLLGGAGKKVHDKAKADEAKVEAFASDVVKKAKDKL